MSRYSTSKIITVTNGQFTTHDKVNEQIDKEEEQAKAAKKAEMKKRFTWSEMLHDDEVDDIWGTTPDDELPEVSEEPIIAEQESKVEPEQPLEPEVEEAIVEVVVEDELVTEEIDETPKHVETSFDAPDGPIGDVASPPSSLQETDFGAALESDEASTGVDLDAGSGTNLSSVCRLDIMSI